MAPDLIAAGIDTFRTNTSDPLVDLGFVTTNTKNITSGALRQSS
jgi:hypothetical protein